MASPTKSSQEICSECGDPLSAHMRYCPTCTADAGAPNVRFCRTDDNLKALSVRFDFSRKIALSNKCTKEFNRFEKIIKNKAGVVVAMPPGMARHLCENPEAIFTNYNKLVGANIRKPADPKNDKRRCAVGGTLFGSYAENIVYGALSLSEFGLPLYGAVHCRLRSVTVKKRTSFLETNSFKFVQDHGIIAGMMIPFGYMACWEQCHSLVLAKLADRLSPGQSESAWQEMLIESDGKNLDNDSFIEAHIFEGFDINAIESMEAYTPTGERKLTREEKLDRDLALSNFKQLRGITK